MGVPVLTNPPKFACISLIRGRSYKRFRPSFLWSFGSGMRSFRGVNTGLSYKIAVLVFLENSAGEHLLMLRAKPPNLGIWSPIGGKLETASGESPFECAMRETFEETGHRVGIDGFHLFAMIAEKAYEIGRASCRER